MNGSRDVALWAGLAAFFGTLLAVAAIDIFDPDRVVQYLSAVLVAGITAASVYSKERLAAAKQHTKRG